MGRKFIALTVALSLFETCVARGQSPHGSGGGRGKGLGGHSQFNLPHERASQLSPEDRQRFNRNAERWMQMTGEERRIMRDHERLRREKVKQEATTALRESGLQLDAEKRAQFESRYMQERSKIEHTMRQELETKRQQEVPALIERLKKEFQPQQNNSSPRPSVSPRPGD